MPVAHLLRALARALIPWAVGSALATTAEPARPGRPATAPATPVALQVTDWVCEVVYAPARTVWRRQVRFTYDQRRLQQVAIDGVPVYRFAIYDTVVMTALDNERVRIDVAARTWDSDFRGQASGQGRCELAGGV